MLLHYFGDCVQVYTGLTRRYSQKSELIPGFGITRGNKMTRSRECLICGYFSAGDLCKPADHLHSWHALFFTISNYLECFAAHLLYIKLF